MKWLRLWTDILDDPKLAVTVTPAETFRVTVLLMAYARELDNAGKIDQPEEVIAWRLRTNCSELRKHLNHLRDLKIITLKPEIRFLNWDKRQFLSDNSSERVKRFRINKRNVSIPLHETASSVQIQIQSRADTETDKNILSETKNVSDAACLAVYDSLMAKVKTYRPNHPIGSKEKDLKKISNMFRLDKRDPQHTLELLKWYPIGQEFIPEIFSAQSLREKYDKLASAYLRKNGKNNSVDTTAKELKGPNINECRELIEFNAGGKACCSKAISGECRFAHQPGCNVPKIEQENKA